MPGTRTVLGDGPPIVSQKDLDTVVLHRTVQYLSSCMYDRYKVHGRLSLGPIGSVQCSAERKTEERRCCIPTEHTAMQGNPTQPTLVLPAE
jgi:hypothetical protein